MLLSGLFSEGKTCTTGYILADADTSPIRSTSELIVLDDEPVSLCKTRKLRKTYIWSKKVRLAVYKIITYLPKIISGNYKKRVNENN